MSTSPGNEKEVGPVVPPGPIGAVERSDQVTIPPAQEDAYSETLNAETTGSAVISTGSGTGCLLTGDFGRYRLLECLGQGAMGAVYKARDSQLGRIVAIKIPKFDASNASLTERFYCEARAAATLSHPGICPVFDVGQFNGTHYISMGYIEGRPLSALISPGRPLPEKQAAAIVRKLAIAIGEAHRHGVVHRDLKPDNVMITRKLSPIIMDFGLALRTAAEPGIRETRNGQMIGTPAYMSPEQVEGDLDLMGPLSDVYGLGVILYELLTGHLPYEGTLASVVAQILKAEPKLPVEWQPKLNPQLQDVCLKMMAAKQADRYASMSDVVQDLTAVLKGKPAAIAASSPRVATARAATKKSGLLDATNHVGYGWSKPAWAAGIAVVVIASVIGGYAWLSPPGSYLLQIQIDDPAIGVFVDSREIPVDGLRAEVELAPGTYSIEARRDGQVVETKLVTVTDASNTPVVLGTHNAVSVTVPEESPLAARAEPVAAVEPFMDQARLAVEWAINAGMKLDIEAAGETLKVTRIDELPAGSFVVRRLDIGNDVTVGAGEWRHLPAFESLNEVITSSPAFDDSALSWLKEVSGLERLEIISGRISDVGVLHLATLRRLAALKIEGTARKPANVSDTSLHSLESLPLNSLVLLHCPLTPGSIEHYRATHPNCDVTFVSAARPVADSLVPKADLSAAESGSGSGRLKIPDRFAGDTDSKRQAAAWVVSLRSSLIAQVGDEPQSRLVETFADIPDGEFSIQSVSLEWPGSIATEEWKHAGSFCPDLLSLTIRCPAFDDAAVPHLTGGDNLTDLVLIQTGITDAGLSEFSQLASLRSLTIHECGITDAGIDRLRDLKLQSLDLAGLPLSDTSALAISHIKPLASVNVSGTQMGDEGMKLILTLPRLQSLDVSDTAVTTAGLATIGDSRRLQSLNLDRTGIDDIGLKKMESVRLLQSLSIRGTQCSLAAVNAYVQEFTRCRVDFSPVSEAAPAPASEPPSSAGTFPVVDNSVSPMDALIPPHISASDSQKVRAIGFLLSRGGMADVEYQDSAGVRGSLIRSFDELDQTVASGLQRVRRVMVHHTSSISRDEWDFLVAFPETECLLINSRTFDNKAMECLTGRTALRQLFLGDPSITEDAMRVLETLPQLESLGIVITSDTGTLEMTNETLGYLQQAPRLARITLGRNSITDNGLETFLKGRPELLTLSLGPSRITNSGLAHFREAGMLTSLSLTGLSIGDGLADAVPYMTQLRALSLQQTGISDRTLQAVGRTKLIRLEIDNTQVTDDGIAHLQDLQTLEVLMANGTRVTEASIPTFRQMKGLKDLYLYQTAIPRAAGLQLDAERRDLRVHLD